MTWRNGRRSSSRRESQPNELVSRYCSGDRQSAGAIIPEQINILLPMRRGVGGRLTARINAHVISTVNSWRQCWKTCCSAGRTTPRPILSTPIRSRFGRQGGVHRCAAFADLRASAGGSCRFRVGIEGLRSARGKSRQPAVPRHGRLSCRFLGCGPRRYNYDSRQHAADPGAICLSVCRRPRGGGGGRRGAGAGAAFLPP